MRPPISYDDVEELEVRSRTPEQRRRAAAVLLAWAEDPHPDDEDAAPAQLLVAAAAHLGSAGDRDGALTLYRRAVDAEGPAHPDARAWLHGALLDAGQVDEAHALAEEVRRSAPPDGDVYEFVGEAYESTGDLRQAHRWFTLGVTRLQRLLEDGWDDPSAELWVTMLLRGRWRVRRAMGMPLDEDDELVGPPQAER